MSRLTIAAAYARVNAAWPKDLPPLTADEAVRAAKRLWRYAEGQTYEGEVKVTSGRRYSWIRHGVLIVNPDKGWHSLVHDLSHAFFYRANRDIKVRPHDKAHAAFELKCVKQVVGRGWLDGKLKPEPKPAPTKADRLDEKLVRLDQRIEGWEGKANRAASALKRLHAQRKALLRAIGKPAQPPKPRAQVESPMQLANRYGIEVERMGERASMYVYPPSSLPEQDDPHAGDHYVDSVKERNARIKEYVALIEAQQPKLRLVA